MMYQNFVILSFLLLISSCSGRPQNSGSGCKSVENKKTVQKILNSVKVTIKQGKIADSVQASYEKDYKHRRSVIETVGNVIVPMLGVRYPEFQGHFEEWFEDNLPLCKHYIRLKEGRQLELHCLIDKTGAIQEIKPLFYLDEHFKTECIYLIKKSSKRWSPAAVGGKRIDADIVVQVDIE